MCNITYQGLKISSNNKSVVRCLRWNWVSKLQRKWENHCLSQTQNHNCCYWGNGQVWGQIPIASCHRHCTFSLVSMNFLGLNLSPALWLLGDSPRTSSAGLFLLPGHRVWLESSSTSSGSPSNSFWSFWASSFLATSLSAFSILEVRILAQSEGCC